MNIQNEVKIIRSARKTMTLQIDAGGSLVVRAPFHVREKAVSEFIQMNQEWIIRAQQKKREQQSKLERYRKQPGGAFLYLGKEYIICETKARRIRLIEDRIELPEGTDPGRELYQWMKKQAGAVLREKTREKADMLGLMPHGISITQARSRWGSCSGRNNISFSFCLMMCPVEVIDYVIIHELCHIQEKNHKQPFWRLVEAFDPAYKEHRQWLHEHSYYMDIMQELQDMHS